MSSLRVYRKKSQTASTCHRKKAVCSRILSERHESWCIQKAAEFAELVKVKETDKQKHITNTAPYKTAKGCSLCDICAQYNSKGLSVWDSCAAHKLKQKKQEDSNGNQK